MIETATLNKGTIFAQDKNGESIVVGDKVIYDRKHYRVQSLEWDVSGDGLYHETVYLELQHLKTLKVITVEDCDVTFKSRQ